MTVVVETVVQSVPLLSTVICAALSCPLWQAPLADTSSLFFKLTKSVAVEQSCARNVVPLKPTHACVLTKSERKSAVNVRCTRSTSWPLSVEGVICLSAAVFTQAASTISPEIRDTVVSTNVHLDSSGYTR